MIPIVEKFTELESIVRHSQEPPTFARRSADAGQARDLAARAGGSRVPASRSKFGLTLSEVLEALEYLKQRDMADCLQLVHFHIGSQITNIRNIKAALTEAARIYVEMFRVGAGVKYLDVGGETGRRLRRLAIRLRVVGQLYVAGIRQRRRLPRIKNVCTTRPRSRTRRSSPSPGVPWSHTIASWSLTCSAFPTSINTSRRRRSPKIRRSRLRICSASTAKALQEKLPGELSRRPTGRRGRGHEPLQLFGHLT